MAEIYDVLELWDRRGRFRAVRYSDEQPKDITGLCDCPDAHASIEEARACPQAVAARSAAFPPIDVCPHCRGTGIRVPRGG